MNRIFGDIGGLEKPEYVELIPLARKRILCATDLAPRSDRAVQRAAMLAKRMDAEVLFVHVVSDRQPERVVHLKANRARMRLMTQAERAMTHSPESARVEIHLGKPLKVIADLAKEWSADLIVVAAPISRRYENLLGTTAERLIRSASCPVLIVHSEPLADYSQIAVATDLSPVSIRAARAVTRMGLVEGAFTWVVHAADPPDERAVTDEKQRSAYEKEWEQHVSVQLTPELAAAGFDLSRMEVLVKPTRPMDAIEHILENAQPELIVIGTSRWFMLKRMLARSVAHQVLSRVKCDILAVPPAWDDTRLIRREPVRPNWMAPEPTAPEAGPLLNV